MQGLVMVDSRTKRILRNSGLFLFVLLVITGTQNQLFASSDKKVQISMHSEGKVEAENNTQSARYHSSRLLVRFRAGAAPAFLPDTAKATEISTIRGLYIVAKPPALTLAETLKRYRSDSRVEYAEPDYAVHIDNTSPGDPRWNEQWDMTKIAAPSAWDIQTSASDVVVAVIDTGINYSHPDLQSNLWTSGNAHGFQCSGTVKTGGADVNGHGTHVAGTIGAAANNGIGIAGINWRIQLLSLRFLDANGSGFTSDAVLCMNKAISLKQNGVNIRVINNSWGGNEFSQSLKEAMTTAESAGILNVCAAGNSGVNADALPMYPAAFNNRGIVSVSATNSTDVSPTFSNYGLASVDIAAPGVSILSTVPSGNCSLCDGSGYRSLSGTSMAAPHVSGVAAALFHRNPALTPVQARDALLDTASYDSLKDTKARTSTTGGRLNYAKALKNPLTLLPKANNFPTLAASPAIGAASGSRVTLSATVADADGDSLRTYWTANNGSTGWLMSYVLGILLPNGTSNPFTFTAPSIDRPATVPYIGAVTDNRGGSAKADTVLTINPKSTAGGIPSGSLSISPSSGPPGTTVKLNYPVSDPEHGTLLWDIGISFSHGWSDTCCWSGSTASIQLNSTGVYRIGVQAMDKELNVSNRSSAVVRIGGAAGTPPVANGKVDRISGAVPLTVNYNAGSSFDPDGSIQTYFVHCKSNVSAVAGPATGSCTYDTPGNYAMNITVVDNQGLEDNLWIYITATP